MGKTPILGKGGAQERKVGGEMESQLGDHGGLETQGYQVYLPGAGVCRTEEHVRTSPSSPFSRVFLAKMVRLEPQAPLDLL